MAATYKEYGTGSEIWEAVFEEIPREDLTTHPSDARRVRLLNEVMREAQSLGFHNMTREVVTFVDGGTNDTYYQLTTDTRLFKLKTAKSGTGGSGIARTPVTILDFDEIEDYRRQNIDVDSDTYYVAVNYHPAGQNPGILRVELFPDAPAAPGVDIELYYEHVPYVTSLSSTVYFPRYLIELGLVWRMKGIVAPDESMAAYAMFRQGCLADRAVGAATVGTTFAKLSGFMKDFADRFK